MHKSQGFGASPARGSQLVHFDLTAGDSAKLDIFEGIDMTWKRVSDSEDIQNTINLIIYKFNPDQPDKSVPDLITLYRQLKKHPTDYWIKVKLSEVEELIRMCSGLWLESVVWEAGASPGNTIDVRSMVIDRSDVPVEFIRINNTYASADSSIQQGLVTNKPFSVKQTLTVPKNAPYTQPYWLEKPNDGNMYSLSDPNQVNLAETAAALKTTFYLRIAGEDIL